MARLTWHMHPRRSTEMPQSELKAFGGHVDMSVERAVCALLMGDPLAAESALRVAPDSVAEPDKGVAQLSFWYVALLIVP